MEEDVKNVMFRGGFMQKISVEPMSRDGIRELAKEFRSLFGLEKVLFFPIVQFIEWVLPQIGLE